MRIIGGAVYCNGGLSDYDGHRRSGENSYDDTASPGGPLMLGGHLTRDIPQTSLARD